MYGISLHFYKFRDLRPLTNDRRLKSTLHTRCKQDLSYVLRRRLLSLTFSKICRGPYYLQKINEPSSRGRVLTPTKPGKHSTCDGGEGERGKGVRIPFPIYRKSVSVAPSPQVSDSTLPRTTSPAVEWSPGSRLPTLSGPVPYSHDAWGTFHYCRITGLI